MNITKAKIVAYLLHLALSPLKQLKIQNEIQLDIYEYNLIYKYILLLPALGQHTVM